MQVCNPRTGPPKAIPGIKRRVWTYLITRPHEPASTYIAITYCGDSPRLLRFVFAKGFDEDWRSMRVKVQPSKRSCGNPKRVVVKIRVPFWIHIVIQALILWRVSIYIYIYICLGPNMPRDNPTPN